MVLVAVCMCVNFTACSGDVDNGGGFAGERKLVKMVLTDGDDTVTYIFSYDNQGRVTEIKEGDGYDVWSRRFSWEDNTVRVMQDGGEHRCTYTIENGLVRSEYTPDVPADQSNVYYLYNMTDRLIRVSGYVDTEVTWEGDKLISIVGPYDYFPTYTYGDVTCKKGYNPLIGVTDFAFTNPELVGMRTKQLPISSTNVFNGPYTEYNYTETYEYEFDKNGYISKIKVKKIELNNINNSYTYSYNLTWK